MCMYVCMYMLYIYIYIVKRSRDTAAQEIFVELLQSFRLHGLRQVLDTICQVFAKIGTRCCRRMPKSSSEPPHGIKVTEYLRMVPK